MRQLILNDRTALTFNQPRPDWNLPAGCIYRIAGGTRGMATYTKFENMPAHLQNHQGFGLPYVLWTEEIIDNTADFILRNECEPWIMLNINDTLHDQINLIEQFAERGVFITRCCIGNEVYLNKFRNGDTSKLGVAKAITLPDYIDICRDWIPAIRAEFPLMKVNACVPIPRGKSYRKT